VPSPGKGSSSGENRARGGRKEASQASPFSLAEEEEGVLSGERGTGTYWFEPGHFRGRANTWILPGLSLGVL